MNLKAQVDVATLLLGEDQGDLERDPPADQVADHCLVQPHLCGGGGVGVGSRGGGESGKNASEPGQEGAGVQDLQSLPPPVRRQVGFCIALKGNPKEKCGVGPSLEQLEWRGGEGERGPLPLGPVPVDPFGADTQQK